MMNFDTPTSTLPQALAGALRRLAQLAHTSSWDHWAVRRLVRTQRITPDGRALALVLPDEGQHSATQLAALPDPLWGAFDVLADTEQETLYRLSIKMIRGLQENGALPTSRMCLRCKFFDPFRYAGSATPHHCHQAQTPFAERQLRIDCSEFEAGDAAAQATLWQRCVTERSAVAVVSATAVTEEEESNDVDSGRDSVQTSHEVTAIAAA